MGKGGRTTGSRKNPRGPAEWHRSFPGSRAGPARLGLGRGREGVGKTVGRGQGQRGKVESYRIWAKLSPISRAPRQVLLGRDQVGVQESPHLLLTLQGTEARV
jgi:hypothetical protein